MYVSHSLLGAKLIGVEIETDGFLNFQLPFAFIFAEEADNAFTKGVAFCFYGEEMD